jgi:hypothetical protein
MSPNMDPTPNVIQSYEVVTGYLRYFTISKSTKMFVLILVIKCIISNNSTSIGHM